MKVFTLKNSPSTEEIAEILKNDFSDKYAYDFFGLGAERSIIVRKSEFVGAQISKSGNQITVHAMSPNLLFSFLDPFLTGLNILGLIFHSPWKKLETDLVVFLKKSYN